jgi:hypothetical protein
MPFTEEPRGLVWINNINPTSFGIIVSQGVWLFGSAALTLADYHLLMGPSEQHRQAGLFLAGILVGAWTGKTIAGVVDAQQKRALDPRAAPVLEAKERGKIAGAAAAVVIADKAKDVAAARASGMYVAPVTAERPAQAAPIQNVTVNAGGEEANP